MIFRLALRSLLTHPIRTLVLACGFGLGVGVMAMLLGVGEVILDQARSPAVSGGGDVVIASSTGNVPSARWILSSGLETGGLAARAGIHANVASVLPSSSNLPGKVRFVIGKPAPARNHPPRKTPGGEIATKPLTDR